MLDRQAMQHTMAMIKKIDSVPKDDIILVYAKEEPTLEYYEQLKRTLGHIRESMDLNMILMPSEAVEITTLIKYLKKLPTTDLIRIVDALIEDVENGRDERG